MSAVSVRPAVPGDVAAIFTLALTRPFTAKWSTQALAAELNDPNSLLIVVDDDRVVRGYALARVVEVDCRLLDLAVISDGNGFGRGLLAAMTTAAKARGCAKISFEVSASNIRALAFYNKAGAMVVGRRRKFYNDGADAVLMDLQIDSAKRP